MYHDVSVCITISNHDSNLRHKCNGHSCGIIVKNGILKKTRPEIKKQGKTLPGITITKSVSIIQTNKTC